MLYVPCLILLFYIYLSIFGYNPTTKDGEGQNNKTIFASSHYLTFSSMTNLQHQPKTICFNIHDG